MSRFFRITCQKIQGNKVTLAIEKLRSDVDDISADGGLEQYCFGFMIELDKYINDEKVFPEVNNDAHPLKEQMPAWFGMKMGRKVYEAEGYPDVQMYEGEKVTNIFRFGGKTMLLLRPQYQNFLNEATKHFKVLSLTKDPIQTMEFEVLTPGFLYPLRPGMEWGSISYNMWDFA